MKIIFCAAILNIAASACAFAAPVTWTLSDVVFDDGGTATGSYVYDADVGVFSDINVVTTAGATLDGEIYDVVLPSSPGNGQFLSFANSAGIADFTGFDAIGVSLASAMTNLGGMIAISIADFALESRCVTTDCLAVANPLRRIVSGSVVSEIPTPAALPLLVTAIAGWRSVGRRRWISAGG